MANDVRNDLANSSFQSPVNHRPNRFLKTFGSQLLELLLRVLLQILLVPVLLHYWGQDVYQDWIVIFAASGMLLLLDFGMQTYFVNSLLAVLLRNDRESFHRLVSIAMTMYLGVVALTLGAVLCLVLVGVKLPELLGVRSLDGPTSLTVLILLGGAILSLLPLGIFTGFYRIRGNYELSVTVGILTQSAPGYALCVVAFGGGGPRSAAMAYAVAAAIAWILVAVDQLSRYGEFPLRLAWPRISELRDLATNSFQYMISGLSAPITVQVPILLIGAWSTAGAVIPYVTIRTLIGLVRQITSQSSLPIGVELAQLYRRNEIKSATRLFLEATQISVGIASLLGGYLVMNGEPLLRLWTHGIVRYEPWLMLVFAVNVIAVVPAQTATGLFQNINQPRPLSIATSAYALLGCLLCFLLVPRYSAIGAALGFGLAEFLCIGIFVPIAACNRIGLPIGSYSLVCLRTATLGAGLGCGVMWFLNGMFPSQALVGLIVKALVWGLAVLVAGYYLLLSREAREYLRKTFILR